MPELRVRVRTMSVADGCNSLVHAILERDADRAWKAKQALVDECALRPGTAACYVGRRVTRRVLRYVRDNQLEGENREEVIGLLEQIRGRKLSARKLAILQAPIQPVVGVH